MTMLSEIVKQSLEEHLRKVKRIHAQNLAEGFGQVVLNKGGRSVRSPAVRYREDLSTFYPVGYLAEKVVHEK